MEVYGVKYSKVFVADLQILGSAFFFGIGFIGQRAVSVDGLGPMTCNAIRFGLSTIMLIVAMPIMPVLTENIISDTSDDDEDNSKESVSNKSSNINLNLYEKKISTETSTSYVISRLVGPNAMNNLAKAKKTIVFWGVFLGFVNFFASGFQQWGITMTSANKVAFIAGFDLFLTPILGLFMPTFKRNGKSVPSTWIAVSISIFGLYLLSDANIADLTLGHGEFLCLISTVFWTLHITYTDIATNYVDSMKMMCVQLSVVTAISTVLALLFEPQAFFWHHFLLFLPWMLFLAISEGLGFTLMAMGQNYSPPTHAAIILSLEGVFASIASYFCLGETLDHRELVGCCLMLLATLVAKMGCGYIDRGQGGSGIAHSSPHKEQDLESSSPLLVDTRGAVKENIHNNNNNTWISSTLLVVNVVLLPLIKLKDLVARTFTPPASFTSNATAMHISTTPDNVISGGDIPLLGDKVHDSDRESNQ